MRKIKTCWVSDFHLGSRGCQIHNLNNFLQNLNCEKLYLVGDIIDIWRIQRKGFLPSSLSQYHLNTIEIILEKAKNGTEIIYIPGNHDEFVSQFLEKFKPITIIGNITITDQDIHESISGEKILVMHGHEFDVITKYHRWLAILGDIGYDFLIWLNGHFNSVRKLLGMKYWSLSKFLKIKVKDAVNFVSSFEDSVVKYAEKNKVSSILCGHIHFPVIKKIGSITYYNDGCWVENCSAILEYDDGSIELKYFNDH